MVELKSSAKDFSNDKDAVGFKSVFAIAKSFSDWTTSKFAILISGLFCLERFIASSKLFGIVTIEF